MVPTCNGSHEVVVIVLVTSGSKVVTVVTIESHPEAFVNESTVVPACSGSHVVAVKLTMSDGLCGYRSD
ncbi:MAG: hypothetical protein R2728_08115 [Chitinophagales bacterium]